MPRRLACIAFLCLVACVSGVVLAGEHELSGSLGLRGGGEMKRREVDGSTGSLETGAAGGIGYHHGLEPDTWFTAFWSHQQTELDAQGAFSDDDSFGLEIDYLHAGGVYRPRRDGPVEGFVAFTVGATWYRPDRAGFEDEWGISLAAGGGAQIDLSPRFDLRLEGRGYVTFTSGEFAGQCTSGQCTFALTGNGAFQLEGLAGIVCKF